MQLVGAFGRFPSVVGNAATPPNQFSQQGFGAQTGFGFNAMSNPTGQVPPSGQVGGFGSAMSVSGQVHNGGMQNPINTGTSA